jgi:hypothetical protein
MDFQFDVLRMMLSNSSIINVKNQKTTSAKLRDFKRHEKVKSKREEAYTSDK